MVVNFFIGFIKIAYYFIKIVEIKENEKKYLSKR